jgi:hypothetical protein
MICFKLLESTNPTDDLFGAICDLGEGNPNASTFIVDGDSIRAIPSSPFAYWAPPTIHHLFRRLHEFDDEDSGRATRCGLGTLDDYRFLRLFWEVESGSPAWATYFHGGVFSRYWDDFPLKVHWAGSGHQIKVFVEQKVGSASRKVQGEDRYFNLGFVFPRRTQALAPKIMVRGGIYSTGGQAGFTREEDLLWSIGLLGSRIASYLISLSQGRTGDAAQFEVGQIKRLPWPTECQDTIKEQLTNLVLESISIKREVATGDLASLSFVRPTLVRSTQFSLGESLVLLRETLHDNFTRLATIQIKIDQLGDAAFDLTGTAEGGEAGAEVHRGHDAEVPQPAELVVELVDYFVGTAFGRWDIRYATGERQPPELPDPFDPLPVCPPGMLQNPEGLPAEPKDVPADYPLRISWPGILVDDGNHPEDIVARVRKAIEVIWKDRAEAIEQEACGIIQVKTLRDYFRRPAAFFADHLKRYSKSRRQAPIYCPLSTPSGSYTLWLYYHRLTDQTLFACVNDFIDPRLDELSREMSGLRTSTSRSSAQEKQLEKLTDLETELKDLRKDLLEIAAFWKPNLNDGVLITASPLWKLFRLPKWRNDLKKCWEKLEKGEYDWAHLALSIWPERVVKKKCTTDRSIAIAHDLDDQLWEEVEVTKISRTGRETTKMEWQPKDLTEAERDAIVAEVKAR